MNAEDYPTQTISLCEQLAETCMLQCYLIEALDLQMFEPRLRERVDAQSLIQRTLDLLHQHTSELSTLLQPFPAGRSELAGSSARLARRFVGANSQLRPREVPRMLQDDFALLNLAALNYQMLRTSAEAMHNRPIAVLGETHLRNLVGLTQDFSAFIPPLKAAELGRVIDGLTHELESSEACA